MRATRTGLATLLAGALLLTACGDDAGDVEVGEGDDVAAEDPQDDEVEDATSDEADPVDDEATDTEATDTEASPSPDEAALEDPCAEHQGREGDVFIDLVAPVDEQAVTDEVDIVGCSNVFEGTIQWRLLDGDGATLEEGFTTAECGTGCVGAFSDTLSLSAFAEEPVAYLQVYWESPAESAGEEDLVERMVVLG